jgi:RNA polymerase sigma factor (sigma-70 family)
MTNETDPDVRAALEGDKEALERLVEQVQPLIYRLALRFFGNPADAEDASQEAMIQIVTRLDRFSGRSAFTTWAYSVATRRFLSLARQGGPTFEELSEELAHLPAAGSGPEPPADVDAELLAQEVRIGCTLAMLLCLDPGHRMAFILGEIMGLDHRTGAEVLDISSAAFRKRLQRARDGIAGLMAKRCGLFDPANPCRCHKRIPIAMELGRLDPRELVYATSVEQARRFPRVLDEIRRLDRAERAGALYRAHPEATGRLTWRASSAACSQTSRRQHVRPDEADRGRP